MKNPAKFSEKLILKTLRDRFGFDSLRDGQLETIQAVLKGVDTIAVLPTGAGKSLCYQLPGLLLTGTTIVISPLISLMKDQREKAENLDVEAAELNSSISKTDQASNLKSLKKGSTEFIYVTPERLVTPEFLATLKKITIDRIVVDEAHCISQWGHDFRPSYGALKTAIAKLGRPPVLALTATASEDVLGDIASLLGLGDPTVVRTSVFRKNLRLESFLAEDDAAKRTRLREVLDDIEGPRIIYASTVKQVDEIHDELKNDGYDVLKYHGRLPVKERCANQEAFMRSRDVVMVATSAFGLGIDKPNVRAVIHFNFPGSLEAYYQEAGRAGRDGKRARCALLYLKKDKSVQTFFTAGKYPKADDVEAVLKVLLVARKTKAPLTLSLVTESLSLSERKIGSILNLLESFKLVRKQKGQLVIATELRAAHAGGISDEYRRMVENDREKLKTMIVYSQTALCRWQVIAKYFGESLPKEQCGSCDNCLRERMRTKKMRAISPERSSAISLAM